MAGMNTDRDLPGSASQVTGAPGVYHHAVLSCRGLSSSLKAFWVTSPPRKPID